MPARFAKALHWDLRGGKPICDSMWVNVLPEGGSHTSHLHTNAVLSGTYYVTAPEGSGPIVFEDPRHAMMMAAPPRKASAPRAMRTYVSEPAGGRDAAPVGKLAAPRSAAQPRRRASASA